MGPGAGSVGGEHGRYNIITAGKKDRRTTTIVGNGKIAVDYDNDTTCARGRRWYFLDGRRRRRRSSRRKKKKTDARRRRRSGRRGRCVRRADSHDVDRGRARFPYFPARPLRPSNGGRELITRVSRSIVDRVNRPCEIRTSVIIARRMGGRVGGGGKRRNIIL